MNGEERRKPPREVHDAAALARRAYELYREAERRGRAITITPLLSRLFELVPEYEPYRSRRQRHVRAPLKNPGVFTIQALAHQLGTTVGALLGESPLTCPDCPTQEERRTLIEAAAILKRVSGAALG